MRNDSVVAFFQVKSLLQNGGAKQISYMSDMVTHVISDTDDNSDISEAREIFEKPVVSVNQH